MIRGNRLGDDRDSQLRGEDDRARRPATCWSGTRTASSSARTQTGEEYGEKRFRASVRRAAALDAGEMRDAIVGDATAYFGDTPRKDDITMIVGRIH